MVVVLLVVQTILMEMKTEMDQAVMVEAETSSPI